MYFIGYIYRFNGINDILVSSLVLKIISHLEKFKTTATIEKNNEAMECQEVTDHIMTVINVCGVQMRRSEPSLILDIVQSIIQHVNQFNKGADRNKHILYMMERINHLKKLIKILNNF